MKHKITKAEIQNTPITQLVASAATASESKRLKLHYDISTARLTFVVSYHGMDDGHSTHDAIEEAIEAYNEI